MERRLLVPDGTPVVEPRIEETGDFVAGAVSRVSATGVAWHAQISHLTMFDAINYEHLVEDPTSGALYVAIRQQMHRDGTAIRIYDADDVLARELVRDGTPGDDILGAARQANFVVVKYDADGAVEWVSRSGPNLATTDHAGQFVAMGLTPSGLRIAGQVQGATQIVIGSGAASPFTFDAQDAIAYWAELDAATGAYVPGSFRYIDAIGDGQGSFAGVALQAHSPAGETALAGVIVRSSGAPSFAFGRGGAGELTVGPIDFSRGHVMKLDASGAPVFAVTIEGASMFAPPTPDVVAISSIGEVVIGGDLPAVDGETLFHGSAGPDVTLSAAGRNTFLAAYTATGEVRWAKRVVTTNTNGLYRVVVTDDAIYAMHALQQGDVLGPDEPGEVTVSVNGPALVKYALDTGDLQWVRSVGGRDGAGVAVRDAWRDGDRAVLGFTSGMMSGLRVLGPGVDEQYTIASQAFLGALVFQTDGAVVECQAVAEDPIRLRVLD